MGYISRSMHRSKAISASLLRVGLVGTRSVNDFGAGFEILEWRSSFHEQKLRKPLPASTPVLLTRFAHGFLQPAFDATVHCVPKGRD